MLRVVKKSCAWFFLVVCPLFVYGCHACSVCETTSPSAESSTSSENTVAWKHLAVSLTASDLPHLYRLSSDVYSGGEPPSEQAFESLKKLGIRTIISVDGARPDRKLAAKYGMRYVHLPFGYDSIPTARAREIVRAVADLPKPVYIHCHHGKHRAPAAAVLPLIALEKWTTVEAIQAMRTIGVAQKYIGLYASVRNFRIPTASELAAADNTFPAYNKVPPLAQGMALVSRRWDALKAIRRANWQTPPEHPDLAPAHEALQLRELFHEFGREEATQKRPADFQNWLRQAEIEAGDIETNLREKKIPAVEIAYKLLAASCNKCHAAYRNAK